MSGFSKQIRDFVRAAKNSRLIGVDQDEEIVFEAGPVESPSAEEPESATTIDAVPLDRRRSVLLSSMTEEELDRAHEQAKARVERTPEDDEKNYPRYVLFLRSIENFMEHRPPAPVERRVERVPGNVDHGDALAPDPAPQASVAAAGLSFSPEEETRPQPGRSRFPVHPNDTPESPTR